METKIKCIICDSSDWQNMEEYKNAEDGLSMCTSCGFCTYPKIISKKDDLKEFYRNEYRPSPTVHNVFSGQRKLHFHDAFLSPTLFLKWGEKKAPVVFDAGAAFGMFLDYIKKRYPDADISGSELTLSYRRNAWHEYGIKLTEEFDTSKKYDLISSYKAAEHIPDVGNELDKYFECLKDDGYLYISVPTWFHSMVNFGADGFSIPYYYDKNHINLWTNRLFKTLLTKHGFEIIDENYVYYDATFLCVKNLDMKSKTPEYEEPTRIIALMDRIKRSSRAFDDRKYEEAIEIFPAYPEAHIGAYEHNRNAWHKKGIDEIEKGVIQRAIDSCPNQARVMFLGGDIYSRYDKFEKAVGLFKKGLEMRPGNPVSLKAIANCYRAMASKDPKGAPAYLKEAVETTKFLSKASFQDAHDATTMIFADQAKIPMPEE